VVVAGDGAKYSWGSDIWIVLADCEKVHVGHEHRRELVDVKDVNGEFDHWRLLADAGVGEVARVAEECERLFVLGVEKAVDLDLAGCFVDFEETRADQRVLDTTQVAQVVVGGGDDAEGEVGVDALIESDDESGGGRVLVEFVEDLDGGDDRCELVLGYYL